MNKRISFLDGSKRERIRRKSIIVVYNLDRMIDVFSHIYGSEEKAKNIVDAILVDFNRVVDLQYTPLIKFYDAVVFSPNVLLASNLIRNCLVNNRVNENKIKDGFDPMQKSLVECLKKNGFMVSENVDFRQSEFDIICYRQKKLFVFECKCPYHPCTNIEIRTTYEHLVKGADQLDTRLSKLENESDLRELFNSQGWPFLGVESINTAIISGNRVFNGLDIKGHPVRQVKELITVIESGIVSDHNREEYSYWIDDEFDVEDLIIYLSNNEGLVKKQLNALDRVDYEKNYGDIFLVDRSYAMNLVKFKNEIVKYCGES